MVLRFIAACCALAVAAGPGASAAVPAPISVVAAENVWGSIVQQLGGSRIRVHSVVTDPNADPHEFESDFATARAVADARYVIVNGVGYDAWMEKLLASDSGQRIVLRAGDVVGKRAGDNPHLWYDPKYVALVADHITADLTRIDPAGRAYYERRRRRFAIDCRPYLGIIARIAKRYRNRPVGATEDIVEYMTAAARLRLSTPGSFMQAVANGTEPPTASIVTFHGQIEAHDIAVLLYNVQTSTSVTDEIRTRARANHITVVPVTETVVPANGRFEDWQANQLRLLEAALAR
jgi:zinc/manganese transport system substrate-binding protein